ncbi:MAG TPA: hypothetical protein VFV99_31125 [Kofleriaceae bacterium]|nr:hypothetical protein [Kofleriaceae bacterium]
MAFVLAAVVIVAGLVAATELMFRLGQARARRHADEKKAEVHVAMREQVGTVQVATLGLLALMLGFTMSMAESRFNQRRVVNVAESNAVGTTFLRANLLTEPERGESRDVLRKYVAQRVAYFQAKNGDEAAAASSRAQALSSHLFALATKVGQLHPDWDVIATYIESLNDMIDLEATRDFATRSHLPALIHIVLILIALAAIGVTGYATGLSGARSAFGLYVIPLLVALTCVMILDLDHNRWGLIRNSGIPMQSAQQTIERELGVTNAAR